MIVTGTALIVGSVCSSGFLDLEHYKLSGAKKSNA